MKPFPYVCGVAMLLLSQPAFAAGDNWTQVHFREVDTLFANPGQGWMSYHNTTPRFPCSVVYLRFDWARVEPEEGQYHWELIDEALAAGKSKGSAIAIRVMTANAHSHGYYSSPKWLFDLGCKGFEYASGGNDPTSGGTPIPRIEPDYADPIYLAKHGAFMTALGKRYDGNPQLEFLDIGSYGIWGEWHTPHRAPIPVRKQIVDMYLQAFKQTPLVFMSDGGMSDGAEVMNYALAHGAGFRRDGVGSPWHEQNWIGSPAFAGVQGMAETWKHAPVIFEWYGDYAYLKGKGWSFDAAVNFLLSNHVSMINDNLGRVPPAAWPQLEKLARQAGYRFVLREIGHEKSAARGATLKVKMHWANVGVGKLHHAFQLQLALANAAGQKIATTTTAADPREWLPGEHEVAASLPIPANLTAGAYTLAVALCDPAGQWPPLQLAMDAPEKQGWYLASQVNVE